MTDSHEFFFSGHMTISCSPLSHILVWLTDHLDFFFRVMWLTTNWMSPFESCHWQPIRFVSFESHDWHPIRSFLWVTWLTANQMPPYESHMTDNQIKYLPTIGSHFLPSPPLASQLVKPYSYNKLNCSFWSRGWCTGMEGWWSIIWGITE